MSVCLLSIFLCVFLMMWLPCCRRNDRPRKLPAELANRPEQLVPIRLEFDVEHHKMRETFVWNLHGEYALVVIVLPSSLHHVHAHTESHLNVLL